MKLFTREIDEKLFEQYPLGNDLQNQVVVAKIFNCYGQGTWYLLNSDPDDPDYIWAIVDLFEVEIGSVSRADLESIKVPPFGLGLERDRSFQPTNALEIFKGLKAGKTFANGGKVDEYKPKIVSDLEKELSRLQRDLNSSRLQTYIEGDNSEEAIALRKEREAKLERFNEVLKLLRENDKKYAKGGSIKSFVSEKREGTGQMTFEEVVSQKPDVFVNTPKGYTDFDNVKNEFAKGGNIPIPKVGDDVRGFNHKYGTTIKEVDEGKRLFKIKQSDYWDSGDIWLSFDTIEMYKEDEDDEESDTWRKKTTNKLENGGRPLSAINRDRNYQSEEAWEKNYVRSGKPKHPHYELKNGGTIGEKVKAKNTTDLIKEGAKVGSKTVRVEFFPAYDEKEHSMLSEKLKSLLKKGKVETFNIIEEDLNFALKNNSDIKSVTWVTDQTKYKFKRGDEGMYQGGEYKIYATLDGNYEIVELTPKGKRINNSEKIVPKEHFEKVFAYFPPPKK